MNISYIDMWPGFDIKSNWFNLIFTDILAGKEINFINSPAEADLIICSTFGNEKIKYNTLKIFYTGENQPPDLINCDYSLSFEFDSYGGRNFRLPHWYLYINWWNNPSFKEFDIMGYNLMQVYNSSEVLSRQNFCSIVIGNPVANRLEIAEKLNTFKPVYGFGSVFNNAFNGSKIALLKNFKYNICFENTISEGYITEKLLQAKMAGCIPIYYGDTSASFDFNKNSFINYLDFSNSDSLLKYIKYLEESKEEAIAIINEPLFNFQPTLYSLYNFLNEIFKKRGLL